MGFFEKAKNYIKEAFEKYGDVANPGGFVGRPEAPKNEAPKAEAPKNAEKKSTVKDKILAFKNKYLAEAKNLYATYGANPGGMIEKPMEKTEEKKAEKDNVTAQAIAAQKRNNGR
ncbi:MAG: hypothetical protein J5787_01455 [Alphaproteobacteria bacterium]|nr:hypothetical protein [Alphaproteobacteria bacterium]MBO4644416.1 hypothetical protein [Alphaproteobacteria bacterium]